MPWPDRPCQIPQHDRQDDPRTSWLSYLPGWEYEIHPGPDFSVPTYSFTPLVRSVPDGFRAKGS